MCGAVAVKWHVSWPSDASHRHGGATHVGNRSAHLSHGDATACFLYTRSRQGRQSWCCSVGSHFAGKFAAAAAAAPEHCTTIIIITSSMRAKGQTVKRASCGQKSTRFRGGSNYYHGSTSGARCGSCCGQYDVFVGIEALSDSNRMMSVTVRRCRALAVQPASPHVIRASQRRASQRVSLWWRQMPGVPGARRWPPPGGAQRRRRRRGGDTCRAVRAC